jgi:sulfur-carrier protein
MPRVIFTQNLQRHLSSPATEVAGESVREVLEAVFAHHPRMRGYVLDDQGGLRKHMMVFVDGEQARDLSGLTDRVPAGGEVYVMQALSGGQG